MSAASICPRPRSMYPASRGTSRARTLRGAMKSMPASNDRGRSDMQRDGAGVRVRIAVRDEDEGSPSEVFDLDLRIPPGAALEQHLGDHSRKRQVAGTRAAGVATELVEAPHRLAVEAEPGREAEAAAVDRAEGDSARAPVGESPGERPRGVDRVARDAERARQDARPAAGQEAERNARRPRRSAPRCTSRRRRRRGSRRRPRRAPSRARWRGPRAA